MADEEGTERRSEDLFEDLDKFFAPIQDVDWPDEGAPGDRPAEERPADGVADGERPSAGGPADDTPAPAVEAAQDDNRDDVFEDPFDQPIAWEEPGAPASAADEAPSGPEPAAPEPEPADVPEPAGVSERFAAAPPDEPDAVDVAAGDSGTLAEDMFGPPADVVDVESEGGGISDNLFVTDPGMAPVSDEDDLLPSGWASGLDEGIDVDLDVPPTAEESRASGLYLGEPTAEMSGEEWADLQTPGAGAGGSGDVLEAEPERHEPFSYMEQFLPDQQGEPEVPEFGYGPDPSAGAAPSGGTTGIEWDEPAASTPSSLEDSGPISIDDLRKAPDEYRDLPGPGDEPLAPGGEPSSAGPLPGLDQEEPAPGDLEAAAEHFAASIREEDPELGTPDVDPFAFAAGLEEPGGTEARDPLLEHPAAAAAAGAGAAGALIEPGPREPYSDEPEPLVFPGDEDEESDDLLSFGEETGPRTVKVGAAEEAGPSWQEPTSVDVPVEGEQEPPKPGRNLSAAILTGIVLAVVAAIALLLGKVFFAFVAGAVILLAQVEFYTAVRKRGYQPAVPLGLAIGVLISWAGYTNGESGILAMTAVGALFTPVWYMATPARQRRNVTANIGMTFAGIMAVPFLGGFAMAIISLGSRAFTIAVLALAFGFDIAAYGIGTISGHRPLAPSISPNKTREGVIGGFMVLIIVGLAILPNIDPITNVLEGVGLAIAAAAAATIGDLAESLVKRDLGVKDMGAIFPGHGGALDRIDSILFVAPVVYYFILIFVV